MEERVTLVLDGRLKRAVQEAAHRQGLSMSEYIRRAVHGQLIRDECAEAGAGRREAFGEAPPAFPGAASRVGD